MTDLRPPSAPHLGLLSAALAAGSLAMVTVGARVAYDEATSPATLIAFRVVVGIVGTFVLAKLLRRSLSIPKGAWGSLFAVTVGTLMIAFGYMTSVFFMPVSLAALIFYLYPILVLMVGAISAGKWPPLLSVAAVITAFIGLSLALGPSINGMDWRGAALALLAAAGATVLLVSGARATRRMDAVAVAFHTQIGGLPFVIVAMVMFGGIQLPATDMGWSALVVVSLTYLAGIVLQLLAVARADPAPVAMVFNIEPLITLALAALVLGERLSVIQYLGGVLVLAAVVVATRQTARLA